jgi:hypothetical protein
MSSGIGLESQDLMDERILTILKETAQERTSSDDMSTNCVFCNGEYDYDHKSTDYIIHEETCATILARTLLRERGTPLYAFSVTFEMAPLPRRKVKDASQLRWGTVKEIVAAFTKEEVESRYPERIDLTGKNFRSIRNVQVIMIAEW